MFSTPEGEFLRTLSKMGTRANEAQKSLEAAEYLMLGFCSNTVSQNRELKSLGAKWRPSVSTSPL